LQGFIGTLNPKRKYVFVLDNVGYHKTQPVKNLLDKNSHFISVEFLPPYSPELNPIETCWKVTKNAVTKSQYFSAIDSLQEALELFWEKHVFMQDFITYLCR
jgi:transposase